MRINIHTHSRGGNPFASPPSCGLFHTINGSNGRSGSFSSSLSLSSLVPLQSPSLFALLAGKLSPFPARASNFAMPSNRRFCPKVDDLRANSELLSYDRRFVMGRWKPFCSPLRTESPAMIGARLTITFAPGLNNLFEEWTPPALPPPHPNPPPAEQEEEAAPTGREEKPLPARATQVIFRGGGRPPPTRRPSGPKDERDFLPPAIIVGCLRAGRGHRDGEEATAGQAGE